MQEYVVEKSGDRIDNYLANITELSRSKIAKMIKEKKVLVNNKEIKSSYILKEKDIIKMEI